jgi:hypothetical protein
MYQQFYNQGYMMYFGQFETLLKDKYDGADGNKVPLEN